VRGGTTVVAASAVPGAPATAAFAAETQLLFFAPLSRDALVVCAGMSGSSVWSPVAVGGDGTALSVASTGVGQCSASTAAMCATGSSCAHIMYLGVDSYTCVCPASIVAAIAPRTPTVFCTDPAYGNITGIDMSMQTWNGTAALSVPGVNAPIATPGGGDGDDGSEAVTPQGSWASLFVLLLIFGGSLVALWFFKNHNFKAEVTDLSGAAAA
jgi:hypothetical protein